MASKIEKSRRRDNLSFSHHQVVTPLEPDRQDYWLSQAEKGNWTRSELRLRIRTNGELPGREEADDLDFRLLKGNILTAHRIKIEAIKDAKGLRQAKEDAERDRRELDYIIRDIEELIKKTKGEKTRD